MECDWQSPWGGGGGVIKKRRPAPLKGDVGGLEAWAVLRPGPRCAEPSRRASTKGLATDREDVLRSPDWGCRALGKATRGRAAQGQWHPIHLKDDLQITGGGDTTSTIRG